MLSNRLDTLSRLEIVLAASDETRAQELCRGLQADAPDLPVRLVADLPAALQIISEHPGQVVLWWLEKLKASALHQVEDFAGRHPGAVLVVAAEKAEGIRPERMVLAGAQECLCHDPSPGELCKAIRSAMARSLSTINPLSESLLYRSIVCCQSELICRFTAMGQLTFMNPAYCRYFGFALDQPPTGSFFQQVVDEDREEIMIQLGALDPEHPQTRLEIRVQPRAGSERRWLRWSIHAIHEQTGEVGEYQAVGQDVTESKNLEEALQVAESNLRQLILSSGDGMVVTDEEGLVLFVNPAAERMLDKSSHELLGHTFGFPLSPGQRQELELNSGDPERVVAEMRVVETKWRRAKAFLATLRDISELKQLQEELRDLSLIDPLTGIYNRRGFTTLARQQLRTAQRMGRRMHFFFVDLDDLKKINDTLGHGQGDKVIREAALVLKATFRESDILGRWGGDEFSVLAMESDDEGTQAVLDRLKQNLKDWNTDTARSYKISFSAGTATYDPERPSTLETLFAEADENMYQIKRSRQAQSGPTPITSLRDRS